MDAIETHPALWQNMAMQPSASSLHHGSTIFVQAAIVNGFALIGFSDGLTVVFDSTTIRHLLPYAEFVYNAPLTRESAPELVTVEDF